MPRSGVPPCRVRPRTPVSIRRQVSPPILPSTGLCIRSCCPTATRFAGLTVRARFCRLCFPRSARVGPRLSFGMPYGSRNGVHLGLVCARTFGCHHDRGPLSGPRQVLNRHVGPRSVCCDPPSTAISCRACATEAAPPLFSQGWCGYDHGMRTRSCAVLHALCSASGPGVGSLYSVCATPPLPT